jgi:hypothetical protein
MLFALLAVTLTLLLYQNADAARGDFAGDSSSGCITMESHEIVGKGDAKRNRKAFNVLLKNNCKADALITSINTDYCGCLILPDKPSQLLTLSDMKGANRISFYGIKRGGEECLNRPPHPGENCTSFRFASGSELTLEVVGEDCLFLTGRMANPTDVEELKIMLKTEGAGEVYFT